MCTALNAICNGLVGLPDFIISLFIVVALMPQKIGKKLTKKKIQPNSASNTEV